MTPAEQAAADAALPPELQQVKAAIAPWMWITPLVTAGIAMWNAMRIRKIYRHLKLHEG